MAKTPASVPPREHRQSRSFSGARQTRLADHLDESMAEVALELAGAAVHDDRPAGWRESKRGQELLAISTGRHLDQMGGDPCRQVDGPRAGDHVLGVPGDTRAISKPACMRSSGRARTALRS